MSELPCYSCGRIRLHTSECQAGNYTADCELFAGLTRQLAEEQELRFSLEQSWMRELARAKAAEAERDAALARAEADAALLARIRATKTWGARDTELLATIDARLQGRT